LIIPAVAATPPAAEDVDRLREVAGRLMRESPDFHSVVREFGGLPAKKIRRRSVPNPLRTAAFRVPLGHIDRLGFCPKEVKYAKS
jgi:hypothetical protein